MNEIVSKIRGIKGIGILAAIFVAGIIMVLLSKNDTDSGLQESADTYCSEYVQEVKKELGQILSEVSGAGTPRIMITLESSAEQYYHSDTKTKQTDSQTTFSYQSQAYQEDTPVIVREIFPSIKGVAVVCDGAKNSQVKKRIINLISCALDIPTNKIYVTY